MKDDDPQIILRQWRTTILNVFLGVVAVISLPAIGTIIISAVSEPKNRPIAIAFSVVELFLIALAVMRGLPVNFRVGGLWVIGYTAAILNLARTGLSGAGPLYLLVIPILILILVGKRASFFTAIFSGLLAIGCAILVEQGVIVPDLTARSQGMSLTTIIMFLTVVMTILILFYRFQERLIDDERRAQANLRQAQGLLEEQNVTLEQKVRERTRELQASSFSLEKRNAELAIINSIQAGLASKLELQDIYELIGEKVREVFKVDVVDIVVYDPVSNLLSMPYSYEKGDRNVIDPTEPYGFRLEVINTCEPLLINQDFIGLASKYNNPLLTGEWPKSALFVPLLADGKARCIISIQDMERENAFNESDVRLLQTLANAMSVAIENAHLFEEIKHQEQQAHEMQRRLADIISFLPDATLVINREGKVIAWNRAIEEMTGIPAANMLGKGDYEYALPFYSERRPILIDLVLIPQEEFEREKYAHIERSGEILTGETITPALKGGARFLYATASALRDSHGTVVGAIEVIRDITDRKNAEEALRKSEHLYRSVIDNSVDVFYRADREGNIVLASPSGATLLGYDSVQDLIGLNLLRDVYVNPEDREPLLAEIQKHGFVRNFETKIKRRDGTPVVVLVNSRAYVDENGKTLGIEGFLRDFSDRKRMEDDLHRAKAEAEQANHAKSAFLANMSHELRTPLNAIIGFTRIVHRKGEGVLPEKQIENLDKVLASADNLLSLINTVLDIAKIEAGRMDVLPANFRIHPLIDLCANTAQPLLRPTVTLEKQVDEGLTYIYSDQDKIRQIILNLLSNAAKFTHEGKITLTADQVGKNLHIAVTDTGIGISTEALPHIFKEFEQADATTTRKYGGTGLGLTISRNLARLLGGDLTVESESGQGSTFTLVIPVHYERDLSHLEAAALSASDPQPAHVSETAQRVEADSAQKHILVIDDDPDAVYLLQENLEQQEFEVSGCCNGLDGLQMARQQQPQAILLDILMPGADGWQVLHDLKNDPTTANIPVILHTIVDKKALGFQLGAAAYLLKPLDPVAVRETLERVIFQNGHSPKRVLVVDDDLNVADMLRQFLAESDFSLESAQDGLAGLKSIETNRPDILLLDLIMPNLDGFGVIDRLRSNPQTRDLPIIVISAKDLNGEEVSRLKETVAVVMKKQGFEGEKLVEEINRVLRREV
jgi:PAS domain S-box-containing protein